MIEYPIIKFDADFPAELKPLIGGLLNEWKWLCPIWLQKIMVGYFPDQETMDRCSLEWTLSQDYRHARLRVTPNILHYSEWEKRDMMVHEIFHCFTIPFKHVCLTAFKDLAVEEPMYSILCRQIEEAMEQVTQDFAFSIARKP